MRRKSIVRFQRIILLVIIVCFLGIALIVGRIAGYDLPGLDSSLSQGVVWALFNSQVAIISGHAGSDSGAVCTDGEGHVNLKEVDVNAQIAQITAQRLRRAGADVTILSEFDDRLTGLRADVLISLHADSCIPASGYKAAHHVTTPIPEVEDRLVACIDRHYAAVTGLHRHRDTVTHDMTEYHAFSRIQATTPAAILEMGFLGGDGELLTQKPQLVAKGVADGVICFLDGEDPTRTPVSAAK